MEILSGLLPALISILSALVLLIIGLIVASILRKVTLKVLNIKALENFFSKIDGESTGEDGEDLSSVNLIGQIVYGLVVLLFLVPIFNVLGLTAFAVATASIYNSIFAFIPNVIIAVIIIILGLVIAKILRKIIYVLLYKSRIDEAVQKIAFGETETKDSIKISKIIAWTVYALILLIFVTQAVAALGLGIFTNILNFVIQLVPSIIATLVILIGAYILANFLFNLIANGVKTEGMKVFALIVKYAIIIMGIGLALNQIGFNVALLNITYIILLGTVAIAAIIAFGIGGIDVAKKILNKYTANLDLTDKEEE